MEKKTLALIAVATIPFVTTLGNAMLIPILPIMQRELEISAFQVSMIITIYSVAAVATIPLAGFLSDRFGRKTIILPGLIVAAIGAAISGLSASINDGYYIGILIGRFLQGIGAAGTFPIVIPLIGDLFQKKSAVSWALGITETSNTIGKVFSPIIGAAFAIWSWFAPFFAFPALCFISFLLVVIWLKTPKHNEATISISQYMNHLKHIYVKHGRWITAIFLIGLLALWVIFGVLFYLSTVLEDDFGIEGIRKGLYLAIPLITLSISSYGTGKWIGRDIARMKRTIVVSSLFAAVFFTLPIFMDGLVWLLVFLSVVGIGIGAVLPCLDALITGGIAKTERGMITALYSSMRYSGVALGPPVFSLLMKWPTYTLFLACVVVSVLMGVLGLFRIQPEKEESPPSLFRKSG